MHRRRLRIEVGVMLAVMAHLVWGGMAFYFGLMRHISPIEIAANRGLWSLPIAFAIVWYLGQFADVKKALAFEHSLHTHLKTSHAALLKKIEDSKQLDKDTEAELSAAVAAFKKSFA